MTEPTESPTPAQSKPVTVASWGKVSRGFCIAGGVFALMGGLQLAGLKARGDNSLLEAIANGMGYYFIGKGMFMIAIAVNLREAIAALRR